MRRLFVLAFALLGATAHAGELPQDPMVQQLIRGPSGPIDVGRDYLFGLWEGIMPLAEKAERMNTTVRAEGKGDFSYACATNAGRTYWALSDASNTEAEPVVTALIDIPGSSDGCDAVAELDAGPMDGQLPGIGASLKDIEERFPDAEIEIYQDGIVAFRSHARLGDPASYTELVKTITYHLSDDVVDAIAYELVAVH